MKLSANELRIGNYVLINDTVVQMKSFHGLCNIESKPQEFNPIPLTEEWLIKLGFEKWPYYEGGKIRIGKGLKLMLRTYKEKWFCRIEYGYYVHEKIELPDYQYVHTLQNLYFALTGKELKKS